MKKYVKEFLKRGVAFGGLGPVVCGIVYFCLGLSIENFTLTGTEVFLGIISTYILGFLLAGASVFNQIEEWSTAKSLFFHFSTYYVAYTVCYLVNRWIPFSWEVLLIFTGAFIVGYFFIWLSIYFSIKAVVAKMNKNLT